MQSRRWQHGRSGELDVFGATRYFAGGRAVDCATAVAHPAAADRLPAESFRGHDHVGQLGVRDVTTTMRHEKETELAKPGGDESVKACSSLSSAAPSRTSTGDLSARSSSTDDADDAQLEARGYELDLGVATGDRRLQGVKVVRSTSSGAGAANQETWVVRCTPACWDHHHQDKFDASAASMNYYYVDQQVEEEEEEDCTASPCNNYHWESDSSSDLFDLDIESVDL